MPLKIDLTVLYAFLFFIFFFYPIFSQTLRTIKACVCAYIYPTSPKLFLEIGRGKVMLLKVNKSKSSTWNR